MYKDEYCSVEPAVRFHHEQGATITVRLRRVEVPLSPRPIKGATRYEVYHGDTKLGAVEKTRIPTNYTAGRLIYKTTHHWGWRWEVDFKLQQSARDAGLRFRHNTYRVDRESRRQALSELIADVQEIQQHVTAQQKDQSS